MEFGCNDYCEVCDQLKDELDDGVCLSCLKMWEREQQEQEKEYWRSVL